MYHCSIVLLLFFRGDFGGISFNALSFSSKCASSKENYDGFFSKYFIYGCLFLLRKQAILSVCMFMPN